MYQGPLTRIERPEAEAALRARAHTTRAAWNQPVEQQIHAYSAGGFLGADWTLDRALRS